MIEFSRKLMREIRQGKPLAGRLRSVTSIPQFAMTYEETNSTTFFLKKPCISAVQCERMVFKSGEKEILVAEKEGKKIYVSLLCTASKDVIDEIGFCSSFNGTPFEKIKRAVSFEEFNAFALWFVSGGYYFKPTDKPICLDQIKGLELFYPPTIGHGESMRLGTGNLENAH